MLRQNTILPFPEPLKDHQFPLASAKLRAVSYFLSQGVAEKQVVVRTFSRD